MENKEIYNKEFTCINYEITETAKNALHQAIKDLHADGTDRIKIHVESEDGETTYGMEMCHVLDNDFLAVGMLGNGQGKIFDVSSETEDALDWLMEDIECAVGEVFTISLEYVSNVPF